MRAQRSVRGCRIEAIAGWSRADDPSVRAGWGGSRTGGLRCGRGEALRGARRRQRPVSREAGDQLRERGVRAIAIGEDRAAVRASRRSPATGRRRGVVPGEAQLVGPVELVRDEVEQLQRLEREEAVGDAGRDHDPVVGRELVGLHGRAIGRADATGPDVDERDEGAAARDDPVVELAAVVVEPAQDAGGGAREVRLDESRLRAGGRAGLGGREAGNADARQTSRNAPRLSPCRTSRPSRTPAARTSLAHRRPSAAARGASARSRRGPLPRSQRLAARQRRRCEDRPGRRRRGPRPGRRRHLLDLDGRCRPAGTARGPSRRGTRPRLFTTWWRPPTSPDPSSSAIASATSWLNVGDPISSLTTFSGSPAARRRSAAARIFAGKSLPGGRTATRSGRSRGGPRGHVGGRRGDLARRASSRHTG
jgi:hypothetical protein